MEHSRVEDALLQRHAAEIPAAGAEIVGPVRGLELRHGHSVNVGYSYTFYRPHSCRRHRTGFQLCAQWLNGVWQYDISLFGRSNQSPLVKTRRSV